MARSLSREILFRLTPTLLVLLVFLLGFLGAPEDSGWLNRTPLWARGDPFYSSDDMFVASPLLIWRGTPGASGSLESRWLGVENRWSHNAHGLRDDAVSAEKGNDTQRILNLGDSATWGLNLDDRSQTYSDQLESILAERHRSRKATGENGPAYEVINAGTIGYSSFQGVQFLREHLQRLDPDVVTVYLGNNDPMQSRLKDADRIPDRLSDVHRILSGNVFYLLLRKAFYALLWQTSLSAQHELEELVSRERTLEGYASKADYYRLLARVAPDEYEQNLRDMVALVNEHGARLILLEVPMNLPWPPPLPKPTPTVALRDRQYWSAVQIEPRYLARQRAGQPPGERSLAGHPYLSLLTPKQFDAHLGDRSERVLRGFRQALADPAAPHPMKILALHNLGVWHLIQGDRSTASKQIARAAERIRACGDCPTPASTAMNHYMQGVVDLLEGRRDDAFDHFLKSRQTWPFAMSPDYARRFSRVVSDLDVEWIDLPRLFASRDPEFRGSRLMHDWVHPNEFGSRIIAEALAERIGPRVEHQ